MAAGKIPSRGWGGQVNKVFLMDMKSRFFHISNVGERSGRKIKAMFSFVSVLFCIRHGLKTYLL